MKNHFGEFDESVLKALRDAYNPDANSFAESCDESFDFVQCQRSDGTIYGTKGKCAQKGAKEVKPNKGGEGGGTENKNHAISNMVKYEKGKQIEWKPADPKALKRAQDRLDKLGTHALRDVITQSMAPGKLDPTDNLEKAVAIRIVDEAYSRLTKLKKEEGKKVPTLTSLVKAETLKKFGIDPDYANKLGQQGKSISGAKDSIIKLAKQQAKAKADKAKADAKAKATPKPKAKPKRRYSKDDTKKQYRVFYRMYKGMGAGHGSAVGLAEEALRDKGFDPSMLSNQDRASMR